jgi:CheY-like chemotaxis protein
MSKRKYKVLVVEDEAQTRVLTSEILKSLGHEVSSAEDGFSALKEIRRCKPEILMSDLNMPGMSGFELLSIVRRRLPEIYVIATSGAYSGPGVPLGVAADAFYGKGSGIVGLLDLISSALATEPNITRKNAEATPIWICRQTEERSLVITCPICLRNSAPLCEETTLTIHETECRYCRVVIPYAIIQPMDASSSLANLPGLR